jgi:stage II sporulation protein E
LTYADSFRDLADLFESEEEVSHDGELQTAEERERYLLHRRLQENQELMAEHLKEMAHIMSVVAKETCLYRPMGARRFKQMARILRESGILLKNFFEMEHEDGHAQISLTMKSMGNRYMRMRENEYIAVEEVADYISVAMNTRLCASKNSPMFLTENYNTYYFQEEPNYHILTGVAKAIKETEKISGDNYSFYEADTGRMTVLLSDGMGSGEKACDSSQWVIEMMESFLAAGFRIEAAVQMLNGALSAAGQEQNMSTLDFCDINLYTGECEFVKAGAACTYIKRGHLVDRLSAQNLPLGVFGQIEVESSYRNLENEDYIIMLSDGVLDALSLGIGEEILPEFIGRMDYASPGEIANQILAYCIKQSGGQVRDDMTVLVTGIWNQEDPE